MSAGPYALPDELESSLAPRARRLVLNRRGSTVWRVVNAAGRYAVKLGYPAAPTHAYTALAPAREAEVLRQLGREDVTSGEWRLGTWNVQPWYPGQSLWERWEPHRTGQLGSPRPPTGDELRVAAACARQLAELHAAGWVHGDVQPAHFLLGPRSDTPSAPRLIDLALARGGRVPARYDFPYRGCLVHYESPEISRSVLATGEAVPTRQSDVFALGASLFLSLTGRRAIDFPADAERADQRRVIATGAHREVTVPGPLGAAIAAMLRPEPEDRPSAGEVCRALMPADARPVREGARA